jgi:hypothetical protein
VQHHNQKSTLNLVDSEGDLVTSARATRPNASFARESDHDDF